MAIRSLFFRATLAFFLTSSLAASTALDFGFGFSHLFGKGDVDLHHFADLL